MCGITGFNGKFETALIKKMNAVQSHRGPDGEGIWVATDARVALGHCRLAIIDLSDAGAQPMRHPESGVVISFNGEIYNYPDLRKELEKKGEIFTGHSDTEVILRLYLHEGQAMLRRLIGIFAFVIWDPNSEELFLARDGVGVKPLYYAALEEGFIFASEIKSLLKYRGLPRDVDLTAIRYYLSYLWSPGERTPLKHVKKLLPGHAMVVSSGRITRIWQFYDLPYDQQKLTFSESDAIDAVKSTLEQAVQRQMLSDVEVGAFLSGGLDSSAIVAFARQYAGDRKLRCFTIEMDTREALGEGMVQDLPYARCVADHLGVELNVVRAGPEMAYRLEEMVWHLDEPQADFAALNVLMISELARDSGIKVLLSGAGGDDIFTGYRRHIALDKERYWGGLPRATRAGLAYVANRLPTGNPVMRKLRKAFQYADLDAEQRIAAYFDWLSPGRQARIFGPALLYSAEQEPAFAVLQETMRKLPDTTGRLDRMMYIEGKHFLTDHNLNYSDKMSMAAGVETRVPFLDPDLIELAVRLPIDLKHRKGEGKWILKKAMEGLLPNPVIYRPKTGFGVPLRYWLRHQLSGYVRERVSRT